MATYLQQKYRDIKIIPDKYNTGCDLSAITTIVSDAGTYNGIVYGTTATTRRSLDFQYSANQNLGTTILIENTSFPDGLQDLNVGVLARTITFKNCYFVGRYQTPAGNNNTYIYEDCTFEYCSPSFSTFYRCKFYRVNTAGDGMNPYRDVTVYDSFTYDLVHLTTAINVHCDGTQIFGHATTDAINIHYYNCRTETPTFPIEGQASGTYANAPIMIQLEYSNGIDISFEGCVINGGGYSIYAHAVTDGLTLSDILLKDIEIGHAHQFGDIYHLNTLDPNVTIDNLSDTTKLYISSVWKNELNETCFSVTNDTLNVKNLIVYSNLGVQTFAIPACFSSTIIMQAPVTEYYSYDDYPFDIEKNIGEVDWFVCYDTAPTESNQIRFVNFTESEIESPVSVTITKANIGMIRRYALLRMILGSAPVYTEKEYLRCSGTQRIDLGFKPNNNTKITLEATGRVGGSIWMFGARDTSTTKCYSAYINALATYGTIRSDFNTTTNSISNQHPELKQFDRFKIVKNGNITDIYDSSGTLLQTLIITDATFESLFNLNLFAVNTGGVYTYSTALDIHSAIIEKDGNGIVTQNLTPVLDGSNVACFYDSISKTFLHNAGTGVFGTD